MEEYKALCSEPDCFRKVDEFDITRNYKGEICERSKKCRDCRTKSDKNAIKQWRKKQNKKQKIEQLNNIKES